jgi:hypothetical protein
MADMTFRHTIPWREPPARHAVVVTSFACFANRAGLPEGLRLFCIIRQISLIPRMISPERSAIPYHHALT